MIAPEFRPDDIVVFGHRLYKFDSYCHLPDTCKIIAQPHGKPIDSYIVSTNHIVQAEDYALKNLPWGS